MNKFKYGGLIPSSYTGTVATYNREWLLCTACGAVYESYGGPYHHKCKGLNMGIIKLTIELPNGKEITLSKDEAKDLHKQLDEMFGTNTTYVGTWPYRGTWYPTLFGNGPGNTIYCSSDNGVKTTAWLGDLTNG